MTLDHPERLRLSAALFGRGIVLFALAAIGIRWPDETLFFVLIAAGASAAILGIFQLGMHVVSRELPSTKAFLIGDGFMTLTLGIALIAMPQLTGRPALLLGGAWLGVYGVFLLLLMGRLWFLRFSRRVLLAWATVTWLAAVGAAVAGPMALSSALYWVAAYLWGFGLVHVGAGVWLHRRHRIIMTRTSPRRARHGIHRVAAR
jgi:hypothetical protein